MRTRVEARLRSFMRFSLREGLGLGESLSPGNAARARFLRGGVEFGEGVRPGMHTIIYQPGVIIAAFPQRGRVESEMLSAAVGQSQDIAGKPRTTLRCPG